MATYLGFRVTKKVTVSGETEFQVWGVKSGVFSTYDVPLGFHPTQASAEAAIQAILASEAPGQVMNYGPDGKSVSS